MGGWHETDVFMFRVTRFIALLAILLGPPLPILRVCAYADEATGNEPPPSARRYDAWVKLNQSINQAVLGQVAARDMTYLWKLDAPITTEGQYQGVSDGNVQFSLDVPLVQLNDATHSGGLTTTQASQASAMHQSTGLFFGIIIGPQGQVPITAAAVAWDRHENPNSNAVTHIRGFIVLDNLSTMMALALHDDPNDPSDDIDVQSLKPSYGGPPGDCTPPVACLQCLNGGTWCPCNDPAVWLAKAEYDNCVKPALGEATIAMHALIAALIIAMEACPTTGPAIILCESLAWISFLVASAAVMAACALQMSSCWTSYQNSMKAAQMAACQQGNPWPATGHLRVHRP